MPGVRMLREWTPLDAAHVAAVGMQVGVYELAGDNGEVTLIGYAGGRSRRGLRGELEGHLAAGRASRFRLESTTAYLSRYHELLAVHVADHGRLPRHNTDDPAGLGRLSPG
jgi:hypothetical protein